MKIIDGKEISNNIKAKIAKEVEEMLKKGHRAPHLAAILVGEDGASQTYVASKEKSCKEVGFISSVYRLPDTITENELLNTIKFINEDEDIDGLILQLPLPKHISENKLIEAIKPEKDVDGFQPVNIGKMVLGQETYLPATPAGIIEMISHAKIETEGKECVVVGRSNIVGRPTSVLMSRDFKPGNCTVTLCHSKTKNLREICKRADILILAIGKPEMIDETYIKKGASIIDVGIHRVEDSNKKSGFRLVGDLNYESAAKIAGAISPVPGGVGPMTIVALLQNTLKAAKKQIQ
ncbi:MAG: bifunctional methylenetetrahydrofolate dehydrogenase/methenyltetrahydrofolate cyclohydrolase FolD [Bacteroidales bacterium]|nr:bifunctional methylenetetrahydrofolate dehydrogenase/methenyltetrahydrofolate cyclohydrolase FolD [Bacteroidales bacterium]